MASVTLSWLNQASESEFTAAIGFVLEGSPHFAARAALSRPFASVEQLSAALWEEVERATETEQLALIRAHPDLAGKAAIAGDLTEDSRREQSSAGLDRLTPEQFAAFTRLNAAYREKFGFPFIICVREHTRESILSNFATRLDHNAAEERTTALAEIGKIARLRLFDAVRASEEEGSG
ncbi:MAG TPA: 2-oxo-4-hydroxy-4-carboxy-5-ureidoimidazoline decarboxylase [Chloroflexota bacterium]|nr:2-oxo-4-hydroxy-4-carboxy-5-ureidoimidazoline decarboxylase [Chloroflexota bacterium]